MQSHINMSIADVADVTSALVVAAAVGLGWFVPLLGWSLAAFLVVDVIVGVWQNNRSERVQPAGTPGGADPT